MIIEDFSPTRTLSKDALMRRACITSIVASLARVSRATILLLVLGTSASGSGVWLLHQAPGSTTAQALAQANARTTRVLPARLSPTGHFVTAVAAGERMHGFSMPDEPSPRDSAFVVLIEVRALVSGRVAAVRFDSGATVEKGETLFEIDPAPFIAAVQDAESKVAAARVGLGSATVDLGRAPRAFDDGRIDVEALDASVRSQRQAHGVLQQASAALSDARHRLGLTRIAAPIDGRVAEVRVRVGDRVAAAPQGGVLVTIVSPKSVYAGARTASLDPVAARVPASGRARQPAGLPSVTSASATRSRPARLAS